MSVRATTPPTGEPPTVVRSIPREHNISFGEFFKRYLATSMPVIVSGAMMTLTMRRLGEICGERPLALLCTKGTNVKYHEASAVESWGSLTDIGDGVRPALPTLASLLAAQQDEAFQLQLPHGGRRVRGAELYLHDAPLRQLCPALLDELAAPRYFPVDFLRQLGPNINHEASI